MDVAAYILSGVLDDYCLGFCNPEENDAIEKDAETYPAIKEEIDKIRSSLEAYFKAHEIKPSPAVKTNVMLAIYNQASSENNQYAPLINPGMDKAILSTWLQHEMIENPAKPFENLFVVELPSTEAVTNFMVYAKTGHETEMHTNFIEYLYVISGSCIMNMEGKETAYQEGDIIQILPHISHYATVTSAEPMIALVQRQACA